MNVLSLFDGMSCGRLALEKAEIPVVNYFASEIDKYAIQVSKTNWTDIKHIGCVTEVKSDNLPKIDLLIGGSPCQGFSFAGKMLNFDDPRSKLFFEFIRLKNELMPKYFLLENVFMRQQWQDAISESLGVSPLNINSNLVSAQNRNRLYWTNIPGNLTPSDKGILLKDIVEDGLDYEGCAIRGRYDKNRKIKQMTERNFVKKSNALTTVSKDSLLYYESLIRKPTPVECERLQTIPDNYTAIVSNTQRYKMIGNGWTVDVLSHIFKNIK